MDEPEAEQLNEGSTTVIDGMPTLSGGGHQQDSGSACVMEYISVLMGYDWTDMPSCTNPVISRVAQRVNDNLDDHDRWLLLDLIPRLTATSRVPDEYTVGELDLALVRWVFENYKDNIVHPMVQRGLEMALKGHVENQQMFDVISQCIDPMGEGEPEKMVELLTGVLDEYDRLAGTEVHEFAQEEYATATEWVLSRV